ncbi:MAG: malectin domain-containing carbohydrate-binding protein [Melioribacteraceae bacterium]|nr:malectin domain-containing carbohydrate-binding protein [Melioribacteraceae bacterium]
MKKFIYAFLTVIFSLSITSAQNKPYKGAELRTKESYKYGRFEVRMRSVQVEGTLSTFFTYFDGLPGDDWSSSKWNEIDIEILGRYNNSVQWNTITAGPSNHVRSELTDFNPHTGFHTYGFEWTESYVAWFIDGKEVYRQTDTHILTLTRAQKIMMNIWLPQYQDWVGTFNPYSLPAFAYYDWVSYSSYTPGNGNYGTNKNFTLLWKDDFDFENTNRWERATHTFTGNNVNFVKENIVFKDGLMILCLTDASNLGYVDKNSPRLLWARSSPGKITALFSEIVDKQSAEIASNYFISGLEINSAQLQSDGRTIMLDCPNIDISIGYNLLLQRGVKDTAEPSNQSILMNIPVAASKSLQFPVRINVGGNAFNTYLKDQTYKPDTSKYGFNEGMQASTNESISNTDDDPVFQSELNGIAKYFVHVPNGKYFVRLLFSENYFSEAGKRVFDIYAEGKLLFDDLDVFSEAGQKKAVTKIIPTVEVLDGILELHFSAEIQRPILNGVVIDYLGPTKVENNYNIENKLYVNQNYPNPFNSNTRINFFLSKSTNVNFKVYDFLGKEVCSRDLGFLNQGENHITWNGVNNQGGGLSSGVYFYCIETVNRSEVKKLIIIN